MNNIIKALISFIRLIILKILSKGDIHFSLIQLLSINTKIRVDKYSYFKIGKMVDIKEYTRLDAVGGKILLDDYVFINRNGTIVSKNKISIGAHTKIGPNIVIYDHDHDFRNDIDKYVSSPVIIGKNVWIGANCTILKGVKIGDNCVIAAGTIISNDVPSDTLVYQKSELVEKHIFKNR